MAKARGENQGDPVAARGCLLAAVMETAALLGGGLWLAGAMLDWPRLRSAGQFAFAAFTIATIGVILAVVVLGLRRKNTPHNEARP